jgi:hypothetical protein
MLAGHDQVFASPGGVGEPPTRDDSGALGADVVASLRHLAEMINQRLQFGPFRGQQGFAVQGCGEGLVFGGHSLSVSDAGQAARRASPSEPAEPVP